MRMAFSAHWKARKISCLFPDSVPGEGCPALGQTLCSSQRGAGMTVKDCHRQWEAAPPTVSEKSELWFSSLLQGIDGAELQTQLQSSCLMFQLLSASCHHKSEQKQRRSSYLDTGLDHRHLPVWIWGFACDL